MKNLLIVLLLFKVLFTFSQVDSLESNVLYIGNYNAAIRILDSVDMVNGYPRGGGSGKDAITYMLEHYHEYFEKYGIEMNRVAEKYLAGYIMDIFEFPGLNIPISVLNTAIEAKLWYEAKNNDWNVYIKNDNWWMFNFDYSADNEFTQNQIDWVINNGGQVWNFE